MSPCAAGRWVIYRSGNFLQKGRFDMKWIRSTQKKLLPVLFLALCVAALAHPVHAAYTFSIDQEKSRVTYRVEETFFGGAIRRGTAVGVTQAVDGTIHFDPANPSAIQVSSVEVDISQFTTDSPRRDERIRREWLESAKYPIARYTVTAIEPLAEVTLGQEIPVRVHGQLTVREVTRPTTFEGVLVLTEETIQGRFNTQLLMTDFGFDPPSIAGFLQAENEVNVEFEFVAVRQAV